MSAAPRPDDYRHLEGFVDFALECEGFAVERTGQEDRPDFGRLSPDRRVTGPAGYAWVDTKLRNRDYPYVPIEHAEIERHCAEFRPTAYVLVADNPLEIMGWIPASVAQEKGGPVRYDHRGTGSGDGYRLVPARYIRPWPELLRWFRV